MVELEPKLLTQPTEIDGKLWIPGRGKRSRARVMFVSPCVLPEEAATEQEIGYGRKIARTPRLLDCAHGIFLKDVASQNGVFLDDQFYTTIVKYLPENRNHQSKPLKTMIDQAWPFLEKEIENIKPDIIVGVGKLAFDCFVDFKAKESDVYGAWFYSKKYNARIYMIPHITQIMKPEMHERYAMDFRAIRTMLDSIGGVELVHSPMNYTVVHNSSELRELVQKLKREFRMVLSVDCEWEGHQHVDGKLRSLQIAWSANDAAYIRFMDDALNYAFDVDYKEAGKILSEWLDDPLVKYIGHHVSADLTWMSHWLGLEWYQKAMFDTEFAQQTVDESLSLGLDDIALRYTDFGKYDWDLIWWRKNNPDKRGNGYGQVPDEILIPYGIKDVLTVYRAWPILEQKLKDQDLLDYYRDIHNPFVTDVFTFFCLRGLPIDRAKLDGMRSLFQWAKRELIIEFQKAITEEANQILLQRLTELGQESLYETVTDNCATGHIEEARNAIKQAIGPTKWMNIEPVFDHYVNAPSFNAGSQPQMLRWVFQVKKYMPVKSTANKAAGMPSISWEKVLTFAPEKQAMYTPAADAQSLAILAKNYNDEVIGKLLQMQKVVKLCNSFLGEKELLASGEEKENGLHYWLASDDAIHLNHSCTETSRPRS